MPAGATNSEQAWELAKLFAPGDAEMEALVLQWIAGQGMAPVYGQNSEALSAAFPLQEADLELLSMVVAESKAWQVPADIPLEGYNSFLGVANQIIPLWMEIAQGASGDIPELLGGLEAARPTSN
jgi:hypothetical protein